MFLSFLTKITIIYENIAAGTIFQYHSLITLIVFCEHVSTL